MENLKIRTIHSNFQVFLLSETELVFVTMCFIDATR